MYTDTALRNEGMKILIDRLGYVEAERFISLMNREPFDYTKWQAGLFDGMSVRDISTEATKASAAE